MRYFIRPRGSKPLYVETPLWDDVEPSRPSIMVDGEKHINTGLIDASGNPIFRMQSPIGFGRE